MIDRDLDGRRGSLQRIDRDLDENFQTGRRARKTHVEGDRKTKLRKRDRKSTHLLELPVHPASARFADLQTFKNRPCFADLGQLSSWSAFAKNEGGMGVCCWLRLVATFLYLARPRVAVGAWGNWLLFVCTRLLR